MLDDLFMLLIGLVGFLIWILVMSLIANFFERRLP